MDSPCHSFRASLRKSPLCAAPPESWKWPTPTSKIKGHVPHRTIWILRQVWHATSHSHRSTCTRITTRCSQLFTAVREPIRRRFHNHAESLARPGTHAPTLVTKPTEAILDYSPAHLRFFQGMRRLGRVRWHIHVHINAHVRIHGRWSGRSSGHIEFGLTVGETMMATRQGCTGFTTRARHATPAPVAVAAGFAVRGRSAHFSFMVELSRGCCGLPLAGKRESFLLAHVDAIRPVRPVHPVRCAVHVRAVRRVLHSIHPIRPMHAALIRGTMHRIHIGWSLPRRLFRRSFPK